MKPLAWKVKRACGNPRAGVPFFVLDDSYAVSGAEPVEEFRRGLEAVCVADLGARTLLHYADLPIGMITSVLGAPLFLVLLRRSVRGQGEL